MKYNKLVRDKIPQRLREAGITCELTIAVGKDLQQYHEAKVMEEFAEYMASRDPKELVDLLETVFALARNNHGISSTGLLTMAHDKRQTHGGFEEGIIMLEAKE